MSANQTSASFVLTAVFFLVASSMYWTGASAQNSCTPALVSLMPCLGYISGNTSDPSSQCCTSLSSVVQSNAQCLCSVLNGAMPLPISIPINQTQAMTLPGACNIQTPPITQCNAAAVGPSTPPVSSGPVPQPSTPSPPTAGSPPATVPPTSSSLPNVPSASGNGSKATPSTGTGQSSDGRRSSAKLTLPVFFFFFLSLSTSASSLFGI